MSRLPAPLEDRSTRLLRERIRTFFRHLPPALAGDGEAVHQMRVAGRRLRVVLPLVARRPDGRRVRRARRLLRSLIRTAASCRDLDVGLALFDEHVPRPPAASRHVGVLHRRLRQARNRSRRRMTEALLDQDVARLRDDLRATLARRGDELSAVLFRLRETWDLAGVELDAMLGELGPRFEPEALHRLRTRVRRLRYVAETDVEIRDESSKTPKRLKALQEHLGQIHDAYVLAAWLGRQADGAETRDQPELAGEARRLAVTFVALSRARHEAYLEQDPAGAVSRVLALTGRRPPAALKLVQ